ncbi:hypothetical protein Tco_0483918 [Tanacetum coccineum]
MSTPKLADTHNLVAILEKPEESNGFEEIIDFLNASSVQYALTVNPTIYTSCIEQFWTTAKVKTVNGERQLQALVDKKKVIITETSIRNDLNLEDAGGTNCLPTNTIFEELARMGKQRKDNAPTKPTTEETTPKENVATPSRDPPQSELEEKSKEFEKEKEVKNTRVQEIKEEVTLVDETQEMNDDNLMFDTDVLEEQEKVVAEKEVSAADPVTTAGEVVTTANVEVTTVNAPTTTIDDQVEFKTKTTSSSLQASQLPQAKYKGKGIMVEPEVPLKKKDQVALDEEMARNLEAQLQE